MELISIIVPVYNVEKYLERCIKSIMNQTYENIEIILVDDGSSDASGKIYETYAIKDARIKVFHQENSGVSYSRNRALNNAKGEYISFVDADDYIDQDYVERLYQIACEQECDIVCCRHREIYADKKVIDTKYYQGERKVENINQYYEDYFNKNNFYTWVVWGKLIKKEFTKDIGFSGLRYGEDTLYIMELFGKKPKTYITEYVGYNYSHWEGSSVASAKDVIFKKDMLNMTFSICNACIKSTETFQETKEKAKRFYEKEIYDIFLTTLRDNTKESSKEYRKIFLEYIRKGEKWGFKRTKIKVLFCLYRLNNNIVYNLLKSKK